jgi:V8-like Glu-specific endopeptidase
MQKETARQFVKVPYLLNFFTSIAAIMLLSPDAMGEVSVPGEWVWTTNKSIQSSAPPMWEEVRKAAQEPMVSLEAIEFTAIDKLDALSEWNRSNRRPIQNGITHQLQDRAHVTIGPDVGNLTSTERTTKAAKSDRYGHTIDTADGDLIWSASVVVEESYRLRVRLDEVELPDGAQIWVQGAKGEHVGPFGKELIDDEGGLWTPSVAGPELTIIVLVPGEEPTAGFSVTQVAELFMLGTSGQPLINQTLASDSSCLEDATCISESNWEWLDENSTAVAHLHFMDSGGSYSCSGGLISDKVDETAIPYFLTANHCISTQTVASSLEVYWDYKTPFCGGSAPNHSSLERTSGAKLLVTGTDGDFTLLELNKIPSGRWFMGFNANLSGIAPGTTLHRISYPDDGPQSYSQMKVDGGNGVCPSYPRTSYVYQSLIMGATLGGSSGSPVMNSSGQIVGQLTGSCGNNIDDACDYSNFEIDGAMNTYWSKVQPYLAPQNTSPADLALTIIDAESGTYAPGDVLRIEYKVQNIGGLDSASYRITFYASTNSTITSSDRDLGGLDKAVLGPGDSHHFISPGSVPTGIPDGNYYVGAILTISDADSSNNVGYDTTQIAFKSASGIKINPGLNGSWYNPATNGQGMLVSVFQDTGVMFLAWFTFDVERPPEDVDAMLGGPGQRWLTAQGTFEGNRATLDIYQTVGGVFDSSDPAPSAPVKIGTMTITWSSCNAAVVSYVIDSPPLAGEFPIERIALDNVPLCEALQP